MNKALEWNHFTQNGTKNITDLPYKAAHLDSIY